MRASALGIFLLLTCALFGFTQPAPAEAALPPDAKKMISDYEAFEKTVMAEAEAKLRTQRDKLFSDLQGLQDALTKQGNLDAAVAVREKIKELTIAMKAKNAEIRNDPGNLSSFSNHSPGAVLYFTVTGKTSGSVWGTGVYTMDSTLAVASVHSGALKAGEEAIVKVTILAGQAKYTGTTQNGVTTGSWGSYDKSYKVERFE